MKTTTNDIARQLAEVMKKYPLLSDHGIGVFGASKLTKAAFTKHLAKDRADLTASVEDVAWAIDWLKTNVKPIKTINQGRDSYGMKHIAERYHPKQYITNGVFIAAAIIAGYRHEEIRSGSDNLSFGMSERSWKQAAER